MVDLYASFFNKTEKGADHQAGRMLLTYGLQERYGFVYEDGWMDAGANGKPFLKPYPDVHFNISHTEGLVVCAFADSPVGVDVEKVKPVRDPLVRRVLHEEERQILYRYRDGVALENGKEVSAFDSAEREFKYDTVFFRYWTLKESYLKREGCGLTREPREILFRLEPEDWEKPVFCSDDHAVCRQRCIRPHAEDTDTYILSVCTGIEEELGKGKGAVALWCAARQEDS